MCIHERDSKCKIYVVPSTLWTPPPDILNYLCVTQPLHLGQWRRHCVSIDPSSVDENYLAYTGRAKKSNPLGKIRYLWNCCRFFPQIYSIYRRGFKPYMLRISLQKLMWFNRYNSLNFKIHFYKWTTVPSWIFSNNDSKFAQLFVIFSNVSVINVSCLFCI